MSADFGAGMAFEQPVRWLFALLGSNLGRSTNVIAKAAAVRHSEQKGRFALVVLLSVSTSICACAPAGFKVFESYQPKVAEDCDLISPEALYSKAYRQAHAEELSQRDALQGVVMTTYLPFSFQTARLRPAGCSGAMSKVRILASV
jgi:hypothetical protein